MKLLPKNINPKNTSPKNNRASTSEPLGQGFDAAVIVVMFFGVGAGLDRLVGTTPLFMIIMAVFGAIGVFIRYWYMYDARMAEHETQRSARSSAVVASKREVR